MVRLNSTEYHQRKGNREVYYPQVLKEVHGMPQGTTWGGQGRVQTEREPGPEAHAFTRICGWNHFGIPGL